MYACGAVRCGGRHDGTSVARPYSRSRSRVPALPVPEFSCRPSSPPPSHTWTMPRDPGEEDVQELRLSELAVAVQVAVSADWSVGDVET